MNDDWFSRSFDGSTDDDRRSDSPADDAVCTTTEMLDRVMADDDANDPSFECYQQKYLRGEKHCRN